MHTAEPFLLKPKASSAEAAIGKLKRNRLPDVDHIPAEMIQTGGEKLHFEVQELIKMI
jgi:hypothetical protein